MDSTKIKLNREELETVIDALSGRPEKSDFYIIYKKWFTFEKRLKYALKRIGGEPKFNKRLTLCQFNKLRVCQIPKEVK